MYVVLYHLLITFLNLSFKKNFIECVVLFFTLPLLAVTAVIIYVINKIIDLL